MHIKEIKNQIRSLNFVPKKFLGQHFLINKKVIQKIVQSAHALNPKLIIEIGPGLGALTNPLKSLQIPMKVIEQDSLLCRYWKDKVEVISGDVLKISWISFLKPNSLLIGNLPYQTASRLLVECSQGIKNLKTMILMFQKEVAQRICATHGSKQYGLLSVLSQCVWKIKKLITATPKDFYPRPLVAGQVLLFQTKMDDQQKINLPEFTRFVKISFAQRRKLLINRLQTQTGYSLKKVFHQMHLPLSVRAEELSPKQFVGLFCEIKKLNSNSLGI